MYHPAKPWKISLSQMVAAHNIGGVERRFTGGAGLLSPFDPLDYATTTGSAEPLKGANLFVRDQRASGLNAVLWRDPSMIL